MRVRLEVLSEMRETRPGPAASVKRAQNWWRGLPVAAKLSASRGL
jgi:hypothetical protein